jgi:hypothetical protein
MVITKTIYIKLLEEGTDVWRPTLGEFIKDSIYKVLPTDGYDPDLEEWEFIPGAIVICEVQKNITEENLKMCSLPSGLRMIQWRNIMDNESL